MAGNSRRSTAARASDADDPVALIIEQLERGGPLKDPRPPAADRSIPLADYVRREVLRSIDRIPLRQTYKPPEGYQLETGQWVPLPKLSEADYQKAATLLRKAAEALRKVAHTERHRLVIPEMESVAREIGAVRQVPPVRANKLKYLCAGEAYDLMTFFSVRKGPKRNFWDWQPADTEDGPFRKITEAIYKAVTGKSPDDNDSSMERACTLVCRDRRKPGLTVGVL